MNKAEILLRAKQENKHGDEREKDIEKTSGQVAYITLIIIIAVMLLISVIQKFTTGSSFTEPAIFIFMFMSILSAKYTTLNYYYKKKSYLTISIISLIACIFSLAAILL